MTDDVVNGQDQASPATSQPPGAEAEDVAQLPAWAQTMINALRKDVGDYRVQLRRIERAQKDADEQKATEQGEFKTLYEKAKSERDSLEAKLRATELDAMRAKIGAEYGLPTQLAARLRGDDEAAMRADAETLKTALPATPAPAQPGAVPRVPAGNPGEASKPTSQQMRDWLRGTADGPFAQPGTLRLNLKSGGE